MEQELIKAFKRTQYDPGARFEEIVWERLLRCEKRACRIRLWTFALAASVSLLALIPALVLLAGDITRSGLYEYFSLFFSDGGSYWKELTLSIAESLPAWSMLIALSLVFICFLSLRYLMKQIGKNTLPHSALSL